MCRVYDYLVTKALSCTGIDLLAISFHFFPHFRRMVLLNLNHLTHISPTSEKKHNLILSSLTPGNSATAGRQILTPAFIILGVSYSVFFFPMAGEKHGREGWVPI